MTVAVICFAVAAAGGITMGAMRLRGRELPPVLLAILHGLLAVSGLTALIISVISGAKAGIVVYVAMCGFVFAAIGGIFLLTFHLRKKQMPVAVLGLHGSLAVASFVVLLAAVLIQT